MHRGGGSDSCLLLSSLESLFRSKVNSCVPHAQHVNLRITCDQVQCIGEVTVLVEKARNLPRMDTFGLAGYS